MSSHTTTAVETGYSNGIPKDGSDSAEQLLQDLPSTNTLPLWAQMTRLNPPIPNPRCIPHIWKYDQIRPQLLRAGNLVSEKQAERRVLMLINPARNEAPYTTDTVYAGLQLVMPNETAPAHRHTAFAMRFIIEGRGGFTAVHGKRIPMQRGDVILTPTWNYHDHGKDGEGPMIWLDGLDLPQFVHFPVHFVQHYDKPRYPATDIDVSNSPIVFPWKKMQATLDGADGDWVTKPYLKEDGRDVSLTLGASCSRLNAGHASPIIQETASSVYHVVEGSGYTLTYDDEGKEVKRLDWQQGDTFCMPAWYRYQHFASAGEGKGPVYLYHFDDKPMLKALGFYRVAGEDVDSYISK